MTNQLTEVTNETLEQVNGGFLAAAGRTLGLVRNVPVNVYRAGTNEVIQVGRNVVNWKGVAAYGAGAAAGTGAVIGGKAILDQQRSQDQGKEQEMDRILAEMGQ